MSVANLLISASTGSLPMLSQRLRRPGLQTPANRERAGEEQMREIIKLGREMLRRKQCAELALDLVGIDGVSLPIAPTPSTPGALRMPFRAGAPMLTCVCGLPG